MTSGWQISGGDVTEWLPLLRFAFAAVASAWTLHDARRRRFPLYAVAAWTLATLIHAPVVLPLYLIARTFKPSPPASEDDAASTVAEESAAAGLKGTGVADLEETGAAGASAAGGELPADTVAQAAAATPSRMIRAAFRLKRYAPSLLYAGALLSAGGVYFYRDYHSFDAHLARAADARLRLRRDAAIREYRAALRLADDAHTHKLLALQLTEDGQTEAALAEFRAAERGGEPDELLAYRIASALDALGRTIEADAEYQKFLQGSACARTPADALCAQVWQRVGRMRSGAGTH